MNLLFVMLLRPPKVWLRAEPSDETDETKDTLNIDETLAELLGFRKVEEEDLEEKARLAEEQRLKDEALRARNIELMKKRRARREKKAALWKERGLGILNKDPHMRALVVVVHTNSEKDLENVKKLEKALKDRLGRTVELVHNFDDQPEEYFQLFEVWMEGPRTLPLHMKNLHKEGDLDAAKIQRVVDTVAYECDEGWDIFDTYEEEEDEDD